VEGLMHHPEFHGGRVTLAKCYIDKKLFREARHELDKIIQTVPENFLAQRLLGEVNYALGDKAASLHCYKMALLISPNDLNLNEKVRVLEKEVEEMPMVPPPLKEAEAPAVSFSAPETLPEPEDVFPQSFDEGNGISEDLPPLWQPENNPVVTPQMNDAKATTGSDDFFANDSDAEEDGFRVEHVGSIFQDQKPQNTPEITTSTLGDLYFEQGQFEKSLRIFEKLAEVSPSAELHKKINTCRLKLGVPKEHLIRDRQVEVLKQILKKVR
jgi:tetratricopeptide (TPR) repeat protein